MVGVVPNIIKHLRGTRLYEKGAEKFKGFLAFSANYNVNDQWCCEKRDQTHFTFVDNWSDVNHGYFQFDGQQKVVEMYCPWHGARI